MDQFMSKVAYEQYLRQKAMLEDAFKASNRPAPECKTPERYLPLHHMANPWNVRPKQTP